MDKPLQILQLCLPWLNPKDFCILMCTCSELRDMAVSWRDHSIDFQLDGSVSATSWLEKNIVTMQQLSLTINYEMPRDMLQHVMEADSNLTRLRIQSEHITELLLLPPELEELEFGCSKLAALPALPPTLRRLRCVDCDALTALPSSLSTTAVSLLHCISCYELGSVPQLPPSLVELKIVWSYNLLRLPALPKGLRRLCTSFGNKLTEPPALPASLRQLEWRGMRLEQMPQLAHTGLTELVCASCDKLQQLPELPASLEILKVTGLNQVNRLPQLPQGIKRLEVGRTPISELPDPLPHLDALNCWNTPIQRLPTLAGCKQLHLVDCEQLQQLPEHLAADLDHLVCRNCSVLQQLPQQLPAGLTYLDCSGCSTLQQLPEQLPPSLRWLDVSGCTALRQLPELPAGVYVVGRKGCSSVQQQ